MRFLALVLLASCSHYFGSTQDDRRESAQVLDEMRIELADIKHSLKSNQVELTILEEKVKNQAAAAKPDPKLGTFGSQISALERKIVEFEKKQEQILSDLHSLSAHANQSSSTFTQLQKKLFDMQQEIASQTRRLDEVSKLKGTLSSISKAMAIKPSSNKTHLVKSGETLEKIARLENTTVDVLKKLNHLQNDRIFVGQEIRLPNEE
jgi:LysM repeat protein